MASSIQTSRSYHYCVNHVSHEQSIEAVMHTTDISPWSSKMLFLQRLNTQRQLASASSLQHVPVADGLKQVMAELHGMGVVNGAADRSTLENIVRGLVLKRDGYLKAHEDELLNSVFDSMIFDESEILSLGEWSGGLSAFFEGTKEAKTQALFELLDQDSDGCLSKKELKEYLAPLVKSMIPSEAIPMQLILLELCASQIMQSLSVTVDGKVLVSRQEFFQFHSEHDIVDSLSHMIDSKVYQIWIRKNEVQRLVVDESKPFNKQPSLSDVASTVDTDEVGSENDDEELWMPPLVHDWYLEQAKVFQHVAKPVEDKRTSL
eukprot:gnl/MRDRNA2_/MRDRNA2_65066_c0_seq1.p1 gnl/MRDRNA2_/MRDRNA2_65066_c0~~gnl/MRDRNA2_/MRDRNA2_65066_c0_seq1.p1  ORF type:complete len:346 (+),score=62.87 gnl/MRDRNA2_/MRDRNA2_65066_c0_seq1:82-1038(+)